MSANRDGFRPSARYSKRIAEPELDLARRLVPVSICRLDDPHGRRIEVPGGQVEGWMVQEIEALEPQLNRLLFREVDVPPEGHIHVGQARPQKDVAARVPEADCRRR